MPSIKRFFFINSIIAVAIAACNPTISSTITPVPQEFTPTVSTHTPTVLSTQLPGNTPSDTPTETSELVVLVIPEGADPEQRDTVSSVIQELAGEAGMQIETQADITPNDLRPDVKMVVVVAPFNGLAELAQAAPQIQFLGIGVESQSAANLNTIQVNSSGPGDQGFVAGYLAALVTPEWRTAIIGVSDTPAGALTSQGFINGMKFYCGLCRQTYPPYYEYPMYSLLPVDASDDEWRLAADGLIDQAVKTIYLAPGAGEEVLPEYLTSQGINIIASSNPDIQSEQVIAVVTADLDATLRSVWQNLFAGKENGSTLSQISVSNINPDILTLGKQRLLDDLITQLEQGFIDPGIP